MSNELTERDTDQALVSADGGVETERQDEEEAEQPDDGADDERVAAGAIAD